MLLEEDARRKYANLTRETFIESIGNDDGLKVSSYSLAVLAVGAVAALRLFYIRL